MVVRDNIAVVTEYLEKSLTSKTVIGEAQQFGNVTLIPVVDITFGFGGGGGEGGTKENTGTGGGSGAGARVSAKAVIVIKDDEVKVLPLTKGSAIEKIVEAVPGMIEKISAMKPAEKKEEKQAE
ncbi:MAG TPA: spore germination protein GerW family protein [Symbiobacteriaceae bacterium]|nr:spore germination protein GerW family protein [Symbiobacteriaceae bacterium]